MAKIGEPNLSPTDLVYTAICPRKLWLSKSGIKLELENEDVAIGKTISKESYPKSKKELQLFNFGVLDSAVLKNGTIIEVKKSSKREYLHIIQVSAYLEWMENHNINVKSAIIKYPLEKKNKTVELNDEHKQMLYQLRKKASAILKLTKPPEAIKISACKKCSYQEFCWL